MTDKNVSKNRGIPHNEMRDEGEKKKSRDEGLQSGQTNPPFFFLLYRPFTTLISSCGYSVFKLDNYNEEKKKSRNDYDFKIETH